MKKCIAILTVFIFFSITFTGKILARLDIINEEGGGGSGSGGAVYPGIRLLSTIPTINVYGTGYVYDMERDGNTIYTSNIYYDPVFNISNPQAPYKMFEIPHVQSSAHTAIKVIGNKYYALGSALDVWELPTLRYLGGSPFIAFGQADLAVAENKAVTLTSLNLDEGPLSSQHSVLNVWDVSNPQNITGLGSLDMGLTLADPSYPHSVLYEGGSIVLLGGDGFRRLDISNPANILSQGRADFTGSHNRDDIQLIRNTMYVADSFIGIVVLNVELKDCPILGNVIGYPHISLGDIIAFKVLGNNLFVATKEDKMFRVINISDKRNPQVLAAISIGNVFLPNSARSTYGALEVEVDPLRKLVFVGGEVALNIYDVSYFVP